MQMYGFLLVCVLKCFFKFLFNKNAFEHLLQKYHFWPWCILKWLFKFLSSEKYFDTDCIDMISHQCVSSRVFYNLNLVRKPLYTKCKYMDSHLCVFSNVFYIAILWESFLTLMTLIFNILEKMLIWL